MSLGCQTDAVTGRTEFSVNSTDQTNASFKSGNFIINRRSKSMNSCVFFQIRIDLFHIFKQPVVINGLKLLSIADGHHFYKTHIHWIMLCKFCHLLPVFLRGKFCSFSILL